MDKIITKDGSETFFSEQFNETYHCKQGALEEAKIKYVTPCLEVINSKNEIVALDFCFGLGYNSTSLIDLIGDKKLTIIALEDDLEIIKQIQNVNPDSKSFSLIKEFAKNILQGKMETIHENITLKMLLGDAKQTLNQIDNIDICLLDPFSPKQSPDLWTQEIFNQLYKIMNKNSILTTYSYATHVKNKLKLAGFQVKDGPIYGRKSPSTIAIKSIS